ncbi:hypothetical protein [Colwellia sp. RSH04]|uniref:hypothetical protein n=1 Tax=Colwellia sp. RSH04 TaxID=2305464 RepID=UPI000E56C065|nr:hypothetical protein [Colwellia sp. RSH04]RHW75778.1 hypothetical protein D1094_11705 [Colwellia sp. RSH04]
MCKQLKIIEVITSKADQINVIASVAQQGSIEELNADKIESLFGLIMQISKDISLIANQSVFTEGA